MSIQTNQPFRVVYDEEKNRYYRVNKVTGELQPSYKTGKLPAKFDPQVTGTDYIARKKSNHSDNFGSSFRTGKSSNLTNYGKKFHTQSAQRSFQMTKQGFSITQPAHTQDMNESCKQQTHKKAQLKKGHTTDMKSTFQNTSHSTFMQDDRKDTAILLPKLKKPNSILLLEPHNSQKKNENSSILHSIANSKQTIKPKVMDPCNQTNKQLSLISPKTKVSLSFTDNFTHHQAKSNKLQNKLRRFCEIQSLKLHQNNFHPLQNNEKSQRFQKFSDKTLLTNILDDSRLSLEPTIRKNSLFSNAERKQRNTVTRNDIARSFDLLQKQNASISFLTKKCQKPSQFSIEKSPQSNRKSSLPHPQLMNMQSAEQQQKLKSLIQKQKQTFLSFYPKYTFKQNSRLLQEQKDRKINLKKLEQSFLENGQRKFGKIFHVQTQQAKQTI